MADFLDRYGDQLRRSRRRRRRRTARASLLAVAAPAAAAVAVIVATSNPDVERPAEPQQHPTGVSTQPQPTDTPTQQPPVGTWTPRVGRPNVGLDASSDRTSVSRTAIDALAVLRRPQTARDRRLAERRLRYFGGPIDGIQVDGVRALNTHYALVPVTKVGPNTGAGLCIAGSGGVGCSPIDRVPDNGVTSVSAGAKGTHYVGVVPDGIARVRFTPNGGHPLDATVHENFYELRIPATSLPGRVPPPKGWKGPTGQDGKIEAPPRPAQGTLEWLDASGKTVARRP